MSEKAIRGRILDGVWVDWYADNPGALGFDRI